MVRAAEDSILILGVRNVQNASAAGPQSQRKHSDCWKKPKRDLGSLCLKICLSPRFREPSLRNPKCWWCSREFDSTRLRNMHVKKCERMPYKMYLARIRVLNPTDCKDCPCDWCGSFFTNVRVRANHSRNCLLRQKLAGDETNTRKSHQYHRE